MDKRLDIMERRSDQRFEDLKETWRAELHRVEEVLNARLSIWNTRASNIPPD
jgi:hypothetical protein